MHNSNSKKILNDTATYNLLEISPANQAVLNHNLSIAIKADRPSYQSHFINHSFYPPLITTSYNHQKHAQEVNHNLNEFFNQTTKTHESLAKKNPLEAQTYLQNRLGFLGKAIDPTDPSSALNQSGLQHVPVVDKFGQTHANFGSAQINNLKTLSDLWQMNNDLLSQRNYVKTPVQDPTLPSLEQARGSISPDKTSTVGPTPASPARQAPTSPPGPAPASPLGPAPDSSPRPAPDSSPRPAPDSSPRPASFSPSGPAPDSPPRPASFSPSGPAPIAFEPFTSLSMTKLKTTVSAKKFITKRALGKKIGGIVEQLQNVSSPINRSRSLGEIRKKEDVGGGKGL